MAEVLQVRDLTVTFDTDDGPVEAVLGVGFEAYAGRTLAVVGESGSGKSVTAAAVLGLLPGNARIGGEVLLAGESLLSATPDELRRIRGDRVALVSQDALSALNPYYSVGWQIAEAYRLHRPVSRAAARRKAVQMLDLVGIPAAARRARSFPHEFSGGMRQRVMIAMALVNDPAVLIADEPTTALDVTVQAQILRLLADVRREFGTALVLITHDLGVVAEVADDVLVMYAGRAVETGTVRDLFDPDAGPGHPYTRGLLSAVPRTDVPPPDRLATIPGRPASPRDRPSGCPFHPRCRTLADHAGELGDRCRVELPELLAHGRAEHLVACHWAAEEARR